MFSKLFAVLALSSGLLSAGLGFAAEKTAPRDCCAEKLACCTRGSACCKAPVKEGCCARGKDCCPG
jgi:hypothetical protein